MAIISTTTLLPMPADGKRFTLTLPRPSRGLDVVKNAGVGVEELRWWRFRGREYRGPITGTYLWLLIAGGIETDLCEVEKKGLEATREQNGKIPPGQLIMAVKAKYKHDGRRRGIPDPSWLYGTASSVRFPLILTSGNVGFGLAICNQVNVRWLFEVDPE